MTHYEFTEAEVKMLNEQQKDISIHPYTCDRKSLKCETRQFIDKDGILIATSEGWVCPCGDYKQGWYH